METNDTAAALLASLAAAAKALEDFDKSAGPQPGPAVELTDEQWGEATAIMAKIAGQSLSYLMDAGIDADLEDAIEAIEDFGNGNY